MTFVKKNKEILMLLLCAIVVVRFGITLGTVFVCLLMIGLLLGVELYKKSKMNTPRMGVCFGNYTKYHSC